MIDTPILVAVDFEEASLRAFQAAQTIAAGIHAPIFLVHVYRFPLYAYPAIEPVPVPPPLVVEMEIDVEAREALTKFATSVGIPPSRTLVREGDPADEILAAATAVGARMIALGTHGRRGLSHLLLGSVADQVVRRATVPVLTVRVPR
jgi:nucleotide-binding universal stress UspA family protein